MSFLITRPDYDPVTKYLSYWSESIVEVAKNKGRKTVDLKGQKVTKDELTGRIAKLNPSLVVLNGHGSENSIVGQNDETLIEVGDNEHILHSRITYAVSCRCGKNLGPKSVEAGNSTFIGYDDDFVFMSDRKYLSRPLKDKMAQPLWKPLIEFLSLY